MCIVFVETQEPLAYRAVTAICVHARLNEPEQRLEFVDKLAVMSRAILRSWDYDEDLNLIAASCDCASSVSRDCLSFYTMFSYRKVWAISPGLWLIFFL